MANEYDDAIDIKYHDIVDQPDIGNIFPNLREIKTDPFGIDEDNTDNQRKDLSVSNIKVEDDENQVSEANAHNKKPLSFRNRIVFESDLKSKDTRTPNNASNNANGEDADNKINKTLCIQSVLKDINREINELEDIFKEENMIDKISGISENAEKGKVNDTLGTDSVCVINDTYKEMRQDINIETVNNYRSGISDNIQKSNKAITFVIGNVSNDVDQEMEQDVVIKRELDKINGSKADALRKLSSVPKDLVADIDNEPNNFRHFCKICKTFYHTECALKSHNFEIRQYLDTKKPVIQPLQSQAIVKIKVSQDVSGNKGSLTLAEKDIYSKKPNLNDEPYVLKMCSVCQRVEHKSVESHNCKLSARLKCKLCELTIHNQRTYHNMLHKMYNFSKEDVTFKYFNPLCGTSNLFFYRCRKCECILTGNDVAKQLHKCQNRRRYTCDKCNLKMQKCLKQDHVKLHEDNNFDKNNFTFEYFDPVETVKETKTTDGLKGLVYYRCSKCKCVTTGVGVTLKQHRCFASALRFKCHLCGLSTHAYNREKHLMLHKQKDFSLNDIIFKDFDPVIDDSFEDDEGEYKIKYFRCKKCDCILLKSCSLKRHTCSSNKRFTCKECKLIMHSNYKVGHMMLHREQNLTMDNMEFQYFDPVNKDEKNKVSGRLKKTILYRCSRCRNLMNRSTYYLKVHNCGTDQRFTCNPCGLQMHPKLKNSHMKLHQDKNWTIDNIVFKYYDP